MFTLTNLYIFLLYFYFLSPECPPVSILGKLLEMNKVCIY